MMPPGPALDAARAVVEQAARDAGRDPASLGMEGRVSWTDAGVDKLVDHVGRWRARGREPRGGQHDERRPRIGRRPPGRARPRPPSALALS